MIGENVKHYREKKQYSQRELAAKVGTSHPRICDIEMGRGNPTLDTIERLAKVLGVTASTLVKHAKPE